MRKALFVPIVFLLASIPLAQCQDDSYGGAFSPEQLDNLVAPIALYPDPLLAQVLLAATFPDQIDEAARFVRANQDPGYIDQEPWDVSVKAVAHYPTVVAMMADKLDWTTALGQAYVNQSSDVMTAVQRLRMEARSAGNLVTTPQQQVVVDGGYVQIWPAQPQYIYVPVYDPALVYVSRPGFFVGISFGRAFFIGAWLNHDFDWRSHRVYYHGWDDGGGWIGRSRAYVHVNNVYVNANYRNVYVNRTVVNRNVNYESLNRYHSVHREVNYNNVRTNNYNRTVVNNDRTVNYNNRPVQNKIIERNMNVNDTRIDSYRGRQPQSLQTSQPQTNRPEFNRQENVRPQVNQPQVNRPELNRQNANVPAVRTQSSQNERPENFTFGGNRGGFDPHQASQRGQESRAQAVKPAASNPAPRNEDKGSRDKDRRR